MEMFQRRFSILKRKPGGEKRNGVNLEQKAKILLLIQSDIKDWRLFFKLNLSYLSTQSSDIAVH
jgi:hypothetical protein